MATKRHLTSNDKETINIDEKTINGDIQTNVNKNNCSEETVNNFGNNNNVNVNNNDTPEHQNKAKVQEKISSSRKG